MIEGLNRGPAGKTFTRGTTLSFDTAPSDAVRDEFFARLAHDLRTPLAAIKASIGVVLSHEPPGTPPPIHRLLANIDISADRLDELIGNLSELGRLHAMAFELRLEECDLGDVARQVSRAIGPTLQRRSQQLAVEAPDEPVIARADSSRLQRCLLNLLGNAAKFAAEGGTIRLRLEQTDSTASFEIAGDGPAVTDPQRAAIQRGLTESLLHPAPPGADKLGLGLPIARAIVERHGGSIAATTPPDSAATIRISLPL